MVKSKGKNMYLTKNEFSVLCGIKFALNNAQIRKKFNLSETEIKKNKINLYAKYGASDIKELLTKADFTKLEVFEENEIPYYEYENSLLVKKIKINKPYVTKLAEFFEKMPVNNEYELIFDEDYCGFYRNICIKDLETGIKQEIITEILD